MPQFVTQKGLFWVILCHGSMLKSRHNLLIYYILCRFVYDLGKSVPGRRKAIETRIYKGLHGFCRKFTANFQSWRSPVRIIAATV